MNKIINILTELGFTEEEAIKQLNELDFLIGNKIFVTIMSDVDTGNLEEDEIKKIYDTKLKEEDNQKIIVEITKEISGNYLEAITSELDETKRQELLQAIIDTKNQ
jgi:predicted nuclease of restriction endonuclease-like RecB superfamily